MIYRKIDDFEGLYRSLGEPSILIENMNRETSHCKIEIVPFDRNDFDFISFIDFAELTAFNYFAEDVQTKRDKSSHIYLFQNKYKNTDKKYHYSFHIQFGVGMSYIRCFVKHHMIDFNYKVFKGCFCIHMKPETYAINSIIHQFLHQTSDTLLHKVAHYFALPSHPCQQFVKDYFEQITGRFLISPLKRVLSSKDTTFKEILGNCPGIINVTHQPLKEEEKEANNDCKDENELQKISIIFPWAPFIMDNCHYFELDDSFYGIKPYVYCVTHAIFLTNPSRFQLE